MGERPKTCYLSGAWFNGLDVHFSPQLLISPKVKVAQSGPTLCYPMDYTVHRILQPKILEWVAFSFSRGLANPGIEPRSPSLQADSLPAEPQGHPKPPPTQEFLGNVVCGNSSGSHGHMSRAAPSLL